jgi:drug/metabolite transporter (DMT)-like permease
MTWEGVVEAGAEAEKRDRSCPVCGAGVEAHWLFCPHCEEPLHDPSRPPGSAYGDVRRRDRASQRIMDLVVGFGFIGIVAGVLFGFKALLKGDVDPLLTTLGLVFLLTLVSTVIVLARRRRGQRRTPAKVFEATLFLAGVIVLGGCSLALAGFIFLLAVCLAQGGRL